MRAVLREPGLEPTRVVLGSGHVGFGKWGPCRYKSLDGRASSQKWYYLALQTIHLPSTPSLG
jgi:hypothetical protein